jgi:hypothetical protein
MAQTASQAAVKGKGLSILTVIENSNMHEIRTEYTDYGGWGDKCWKTTVVVRF